MNREELIRSREKIVKISESENDIFDLHCNLYDKMENIPNVMGQYFLHEYVEFKDGKLFLHYPKLSIYVNCLIYDQALVIEYINYRRKWEWNFTYDQEDSPYKPYLAESNTIIDECILWDDQLLIYDVWDSKPNWSQLKASYSKTWWFRKEPHMIRDFKLNSILKK